MKPDYSILRSFGSINPLLLLIWWSLIDKILQKIYKTPLILFHAARLMTRLMGVRPAVDLSWKALLYYSVKVVLFEHNSYTVRWTTVLRSGESWPKACGVLCAVSNLVSITFCERFMWILRFCDAWLLGIVMSMQVSRFTAQFVKILNGLI